MRPTGFCLNQVSKLTRCRNGVADEELARKELERGRKRTADGTDHPDGARKRSRSAASSYSSTSVSTISTNLSHSPPPHRGSKHSHGSSRISREHGQALPFKPALARKLRRSSTTSTMSYTSDSSVDRARKGSPRDRDQNQSRSIARKRRRSSASSMSYTSDSSSDGKRKKRFTNEHRNTRRRRSSISPDTRGRDRKLQVRGSRRTRSRSHSVDRSQVARNRQSMTPGAPPIRDRPISNRDGPRKKDHSSARDREKRYLNDDDRYGSSFRNENRDDRTTRPPQPLQQQKERSLSPFSKRLALTQAMNMGS